MTGEKATMDAPQIYVERTLAIVKPDAIHKSEEIEDIILRSGFAILQVKTSAKAIRSNFLENIDSCFSFKKKHEFVCVCVTCYNL